MKTYSITFNGVWQGDYVAYSWCSAVRAYCKEYGTSVEECLTNFGVMPEVTTL